MYYVPYTVGPWACRTHGTAVAAFRALDTGGNGQTSNCKLSRKELERCKRGDEPCKVGIKEAEKI